MEKYKMKDKNHSFNIGSSDYSAHSIQPWDIWEALKPNPWDADIIKRVLRKKGSDEPALDYQKIKHICLERMRQVKERIVKADMMKLEVLGDYRLSVEESGMVHAIFNVLADGHEIKYYSRIINLCDIALKELGEAPANSYTDDDSFNV